MMMLLKIRNKSSTQIIFALLVIIASFVFICYKFFQYFNMKAVECWPTTSGDIVKVRMYRKISKGGGRTSASSSSMYFISIIYKYKVAGVEYQSSRASYYGDLSFGSEHERSKMFAAIEKKLTVHYHPDRHYESYIYYTDSEDILVGLGIGIFVLLFGLNILIQPESSSSHWKPIDNFKIIP